MHLSKQLVFEIRDQWKMRYSNGTNEREPSTEEMATMNVGLTPTEKTMATNASLTPTEKMTTTNVGFTPREKMAATNMGLTQRKKFREQRRALFQHDKMTTTNAGFAPTEKNGRSPRFRLLARLSIFPPIEIYR